MYKILRNFSFPYGHRLSKHDGLCKNIHGHNWKLQVQLKSKSLDKNDMVIDFSDLKKIVNTIVCDPFDHAIVLNSDDTKTYNLVKEIQEKGKVILIEKADPTAEKIVENIFMMIQDWVNKTYDDREIEVDFVRIWENDNSMAEFSI